MALLKSGSYGHRIRRMGSDWYRISWTLDSKYGRIRYPRGHHRDTDYKGAVRFAKKWKLALPKEEA